MRVSASKFTGYLCGTPHKFAEAAGVPKREFTISIDQLLGKYSLFKKAPVKFNKSPVIYHASFFHCKSLLHLIQKLQDSTS